MFKYVSKSFKILNNNLILTQPPILLCLVLSILLAQSAVLFVQNKIIFLFFILILCLFALACFSGWLYMIKKSISLWKEKVTFFENDKNIEINNNLNNESPFSLLKYFFPGVGKYFLSVLTTTFSYIFLYLIISIFFYILEILIFGMPNLNQEKIKTILTSQSSFYTYIESMPKSKLLYHFLINSTYSFLTMLWLPAIFYSSKNTFKALFGSIKVLFKDFTTIFSLAIFLAFIYYVVGILNIVGGKNLILALFAFILFFYYITYFFMVMFLYYEKQAQNNSDSRTDMCR